MDENHFMDKSLSDLGLLLRGIRRRFGNVRASLDVEKIIDNFILRIHVRIWQTEIFEYKRLL